jgi:hypothetical protein
MLCGASSATRCRHWNAYSTELALNLVKSGLQPGAIGYINPHSYCGNTDREQFGKHLLVLIVVSPKHSDGSSGFG